MNRILRCFIYSLAGTFFLTFLSACSLQSHLLRNAGDLIAQDTSSSDDDLELLMHASAYHLKISESLLNEIPDHRKLAESVTRGFTQYAFVFLMDEADRAESDSIQKATQLRTRAAKMMLRAKTAGLKSLSIHHPSLSKSLYSSHHLNALSLSQDEFGLAYWTMTAWAGAISLSKDSPELVADFPQVLMLAELLWKVSPQMENGSLASMMGILELAKPNANLEKANHYFDLGIQWRTDQVAPLVSKAENWAVVAHNKEAFVELLQKAIQQSSLKTDLSNTVMQRRAKWLLENVDNYF